MASWSFDGTYRKGIAEDLTAVGLETSDNHKDQIDSRQY